MNGKKAKALRRFCRKNGAYSEAPKYKVVSHGKRVFHTRNPQTGMLEMKSVERTQIINENKFTYRRAKKAYKNGEFTI